VHDQSNDQVSGGVPTPDAWTAVPVAKVAARVRVIARGTRPPVIVAVDGRSGAGKSTVADQLALMLDAAPVIHTDDVAWHHSFFEWWPLMREHVLGPLRVGREVAWRPPGWVARERAGSIVVPASPIVLVEGVSASRRELADLLDAAIWVDGDIAEQERRGVARDGGDDAAQRFWDEWQAAERPLLDADEPWDRADLLVLGTPAVPAPSGSWWAHWGPGGRLGS
jgi:hypothetical protein